MNTFSIKRLVPNAFFRALSLGLVLASLTLGAQTNSVSPLSIEGLGETGYGITPNYMAMGGSGVAFIDSYSINMLNPAGYANLDYATMEMSGAHRSFRQQIGASGIDQLNHNTYFDYFGFGFQFADWIGGAFSLSPYAAKGYNISVLDTSADFGAYEYRSVGSGGVDQFTGGLAVQPFPWLNLGANVRYIFGETTTSNKTIIQDTRFLSVQRTTRLGLNDMTFDLGAQLHKEVGGYLVSAGATYSTGGAMNAREITSQYSFISAGIVERPVDTLYYNLATGGSVTLPTAYSVGIGISKPYDNSPVSAWDLLLDYKRVNWTELSTFTPTGGTAVSAMPTNSDRYSAGLVFVPSQVFKALGRNPNYFALTRYRLGAFQEQGQFHWDANPYTVREVSFGANFPIIYRSLAPGEQKASFLNISMGYGTRWDGVDTSLKENYLNFNLGITLNDKWFQKFRYR